ncbi:MAG: PEP-CTERM sorting domain-containing protein [Kiritimatiellia bacterium]
MNNRSKFFLSLLIIMVIGSRAALAMTLFWYNDFDNNQYMFDTDESTLLESGDLVQLIRITNGFSTSPIDLNSSDAIDSSFHELLGTTLIDDFGLGGGEFDGGSVSLTLGTDINTGDQVFVRVWNTPPPSGTLAPTPLNGIPSSAYGNSSTYTITSTLNTGTEDFLVQSVSTTNVIPEPTTLLAVLMGIVGLVGFRRHLQKK